MLSTSSNLGLAGCDGEYRGYHGRLVHRFEPARPVQRVKVLVLLPPPPGLHLELGVHQAAGRGWKVRAVLAA